MSCLVALQALDRIQDLPVWVPAKLICSVVYGKEPEYGIFLTCLGKMLTTERDVEKVLQFLEEDVL